MGLPEDIQSKIEKGGLKLVPEINAEGQPVVYTADEWGTAQAIRDDHQRSLRWCETWQKWLVSDRKPGVWVVDDYVDHRRKALITCVKQEERHPTSNVRFTSYGHNKNALSLAKPLLAITPSQFDTDPWILNCPAGVLDLRTNRMRPHSGELCMMQTAVNPASEWSATDTPYWISHLNTMCKGNVEIMEFLRRLAGLTLIGDQNAKPHLSPQLNGLGRNGKGVFCQGILYGLGDYGFSASSRLLTAKENEHTTEQASLRGKRMVVIEEVKRINSSLFKDLTGGGIKTARRMRSDDMQFLKSWTLWFNNNGPMMFNGDMSDGLWQRVPRIDFGQGIAEKDRLDDYAIRLKDEAPGVLAWAIQGCLEYLHYGIEIPESVRGDTEERKSDADPIKMFIAENYEEDSTEKVLGSDFAMKYTIWCKNRGENPGGMRSIYDELRTRMKFEVKAGTKNKTYIYGIKQRPLSLSELEQTWAQN